MKIDLYIGIILLILSPFSHSQSIVIPSKYSGDSLIESAQTISQIEQNCLRAENYWQLTEGERKKGDERCALYNLPFDFNFLYESINNKTIIFSDIDFQLILTKKSFDYIFNKNQYIGEELILSLVNKDEVKDEIVLANHYSNETSFASAGYQYYYLSPKGDIYILQLIETDEGISPLLWKHYWIDKKNSQFSLQKMLINRTGIQYQIIYPDQFYVLSDSSSIYKPEEFESCLNDKYNHQCRLDVYIYYSNLFKQKIASSNKKQKNQIEQASKMGKEINSICLKNQSPSHFNEIDNYIDRLMSCLIEHTKQNLNQFEH